MSATNLSEVLAWVNDVRAAHGIGEPLTELPRGTHSGFSCPIAQAFGLSDEGGGYAGTCHATLATGVRVNYPMSIRMFVRDFDCGQFPNLEHESAAA